MKPAKISRRYGIHAEPAKRGNGFVGVYEFPGKDRQEARHQDGSVEVFETEDAAIAAAGEELCDALNGRQVSNSKHGYKRLTGAELAVQLAGLNLSPAEFSRLMGTSQKRIMQWIDGEEDIPHNARVLLTLLSMPGALLLATQITSAAMVAE